MPAHLSRRLSAASALCAGVVVLWATAVPSGQQGGRGGGPVRDGQTRPAVGTGEISGVVLLGGSGTPVRRARVMLSGTELGGSRTAITDDQGRFAFQLLPAGQFTMTAVKAGYLDMAYGAKRPGRPGTPIRLAEGQRIERLSIVMPRGGVITGVVIDENGEPSPGTQVRALRYVLRTGERTLVFAGQDQTDDRGTYRIFGLQPGEYVLSAVPRNLNPATDMRQLIASQAAALQDSLQSSGAPGGRGFMLGTLTAAANSPAAQQAIDELIAMQQTGADGQQSVAYAPVYYPGTSTPSSAAPVALGVSEERSGVDFQLQLVSTATIQGTVVSQDGVLPEGTQVALVSADSAGVPLGVGTTMARTDGNGQFTFRDVTPGQYTLQARSVVRRPDAPGAARGGRGGRGPVPPSQIAQVLWASTDVGVAGQDVSNLQLLLQPGMAVSGRLEFRGATPAPSELADVRLTLSPRGQQPLGAGNIPPAEVDDFGRFTIRGVTPGRYTLSGGVSTAGAGGGGGRGAGRGAVGSSWSLSSAIVDGRDVLDFPLDIAPNQPVEDALLTFTDRTQGLTGRIQDASGRPTADFTIIVFPADTRYWQGQARRILSTRPGTDGSFEFRSLPSGDYRLTAVTDVEPGEWYDPAFLSQLVQVSIPIAIGDGELKVQDIRVAN